MSDAAIPMNGPPRLEVRNCAKAFPGVQALSGVSLSVMPGEVHALLGENGAGKSTLGKIVGGVYSLDAGEILLDGKPLGTIDEAAAGAEIGDPAGAHARGAVPGAIEGPLEAFVVAAIGAAGHRGPFLYS